jgi:hypothetical protein
MKRAKSMKRLLSFIKEDFYTSTYSDRKGRYVLIPEYGTYKLIVLEAN